jgi:hypothetical protein
MEAMERRHDRMPPVPPRDDDDDPWRCSNAGNVGLPASSRWLDGSSPAAAAGVRSMPAPTPSPRRERGDPGRRQPAPPPPVDDRNDGRRQRKSGAVGASVGTVALYSCVLSSHCVSTLLTNASFFSCSQESTSRGRGKRRHSSRVALSGPKGVGKTGWQGMERGG